MHARRNEQIIWNEFRQGSERAYSLLFFRYSDLLLSYGYAITSDREQIKDCIQELFLDLWRRKEQLSELEKVQHYLLKAFRQILLRRIKQDEKRRLGVFSDRFDLPVEEHIIHNESDTYRSEFLFGKIENLPQRQKEIIYLKYYQNLSYDEICEIMGLQQQAAWNLVSRAINKLREMIADRRYILPLFLMGYVFAR
ncbi:MAG: sigma-70 family RNA polymerase sigma factor [Bacteroidia bacterium]|nr:sigma-70 family RNA polymerase sigma factor [Bacteroidia bacterium]